VESALSLMTCVKQCDSTFLTFCGGLLTTPSGLEVSCFSEMNQYSASKRWYSSTGLQGVVSQKTLLYLT